MDFYSLIGGQPENCQLLILLRVYIRNILTVSYCHHVIIGRTSKHKRCKNGMISE